METPIPLALSRYLGIALIVAAAGISSPAHGGQLITSAADPALAGAAVEGFDSVSTGSYSSLAFPDVTVSSPYFAIYNDANGQYAPPDPAGDQFIFSDNYTITFTFNAPVSAFGFVLGATNFVQPVSIYDTFGSLITTFNIPNQVATMGYPYSGYYGYASDSADIGSFSIASDSYDIWIMDDLSYARGGSTSVPDGGNSAALLGLGLCVVSALRRKLALC